MTDEDVEFKKKQAEEKKAMAAAAKATDIWSDDSKVYQLDILRRNLSIRLL